MSAPPKVLLELRAAFDGHSGIPQETRLLFRGLAGVPGIAVEGLIQSNNLLVAPGLPVRRGQVQPLPADEAIDRLSKVVVSLQQGPLSHVLEAVKRRLVKLFGSAWAVFTSLFGAKVPLGGFNAAPFKDFVWRAMFARSLPEDDFDLVTSRPFRVLRWPWSVLHAIGVVSGVVLRRPLYPRFDTTGVDIVIVETPCPGRVARGTTMVVRYHDAIPILMPHTIKNRSYHRAAHFDALRRNARDGAWFACVSEATRQDLIAVMPEVTARAVTIPNMVSHHFFNEPSSPARVAEIVWSRKNRSAPHEGGAEVAAADLVDGALHYLLMVGTVEPRKNHLALLDAWEMLRAEGPLQSRLNLVVVGAFGWDNDAIVQRFSPWLQRGGLHLLEGVPAADLRLLYRHACVTVCPSFSEGFDFPGIEAMRCGGVVAASDIPVHRGVFGDACEYFNPYSAQDQARTLRALVDPAGHERLDALRRMGAEVSAHYTPERVMPQWQTFLQRLVAP